MEMYLGRRGVRQIRDAARDAIEDGESESLREEIMDAFSEEDVTSIERVLDGEDFYDFISSMLDDWSGDDIDELFELIESQFAEIGIDLTTEYTDEDDIDDGELLDDDEGYPVDDDDEGFDDDDDDDDDDDVESEDDDEF